MKKRKFHGIAAVLFVLSICFLFLEGIKGFDRSCFSFIFGNDEITLLFKAGFKYCFPLIIAFVALVAVLIMTVLCYTRRDAFVLPIVATICGEIASVVFFFALQLSFSANEIEAYVDLCDLGIGFILSGIFGFLGSIVVGVSLAGKE